MQLLLASHSGNLCLQARDSTSPIHSTTLPPPREGPHCAARMSDAVRLRVGGVVFEAEKSTLLRFRNNTFFHGLFSSGRWRPEADGAYFVDRPAIGFDRILEYLSSGKLSVEGLSDLEEEFIYSSLDYLLIPYRRLWRYTTQLDIEGFGVSYVFELKDGRLCGAYKHEMRVWSMAANAIEMTLKGHTATIYQVIQLEDTRVCSCSDDTTIKLWSIDTGLCELTLTGHTDGVYCIVQLFDGKLCSGSWDMTIRVWNLSTGVCEMNLTTDRGSCSLVQLADGRICCGDSGGTLSIYNVPTGECELSWKGHTQDFRSIVCIESTRICSNAGGCLIKVWNTATGEH